jgi:hypothetical protein
MKLTSSLSLFLLISCLSAGSALAYDTPGAGTKPGHPASVPMYGRPGTLANGGPAALQGTKPGHIGSEGSYGRPGTLANGGRAPYEGTKPARRHHHGRMHR